MQHIHPLFLEELRLTTRARVELWEFYPSDETEYSPENAIARFANTGHNFTDAQWAEIIAAGLLPSGTAKQGGFRFDGQNYPRRVISRGDIRRYLGKQANTVSLSLANNDFALSHFVTDYRLEGMWVICRTPSLKVPTESLVLFAGRCSKPSKTSPELTVTISQDTGASDDEIPSRKLNVICPLAVDFKGKACRGNKPLSEHTAAYRAATDCPGTREFCNSVGNLDNNQGISFTPISGNFSYQVEETRRFLLFFTKKKKRTVSAQWSSVSDAQQDQPIPECGGLVQVEAVPLMHADTGAKVKYLQALCGQDTDEVFNVVIRDKQYLPAPDTGTQQVALGKFGSQGQPESVQFPGAGKFSGLTWVEGVALGSDPADANDSSPTVTAILRARKFETPTAQGVFSEDTISWTDCGPYMVRHYLVNNGRILRSQMDDESVVESAKKTFEPVVDDTGFEQLVLPRTLTGGVDFKAYASAGGFGAATIDKILLMMAQGKRITGGYGQLVEAYYRYINQTNLPTFVAAHRKVRRRYTTNFVLKEQTKLGDFIHDILLPTFNGQLIYSAQGKIQIRVDGPAVGTYLREAIASGVTDLPVEDVTVWQRRLGSLIVLGAHTAAAELVRVKDWRYAQHASPLATTGSATGTLTVALSSATLTGGNDTIPNQCTVTLGGTVSAGSKVTLTIDGIAVDYTAQAGDDRDAIAGYLAATINGEPTLNRYIRADWTDTNGSVIILKAKTGVLELYAATTKPHAVREELVRVETAFGGSSEYDQKIRENSFEWPLGERASSYNRFKGEIRSITHDWATVPIERNVIWHQKAVRRTNTLDVNLSAVDTAHQAARLLKIKAGKERVCDWFCSFVAGGDALLLDLGDVIAVSHYSSDRLVYVPVVIEDITVDKDQHARIVARLYRSEIYDDRIAAIDSPIVMPLGGYTRLAFTASASTNLLTIPGHSLLANDVIYVAADQGATLPAPLAENTPYYVVSVSGNNVGISETLGGAGIDLTTDGSGALYVLIGLSNNTDVPNPNGPGSGGPSDTGLGLPKDPPDYPLDGYGTGGGLLLS